MIPLAAGLAIGQGGYQLYQAYKNKQEADRLAKEGPQDPTPLAFRQMQQNLANQSNNAQIAGYGQTMDNMNEQQATALGEAKRAGITSSNLLNTLTRLNQQRQKSNRDLGVEGSRAQMQRLGQYNQALQTRGQYQEQGRQENARAIGALRGASKQNVYNALTSGIGAASYGMDGVDLEAKQDLLESEGYDPVDMENTDYRKMSLRTIAKKLRNARTPSTYMAPDATDPSLIEPFK